MMRGGGIVASRMLQRLIDDRDKFGLQTQIVHVFRTYVDGAHGPSIFMRRRGGDGWAYQGFNYPKSVWGGQLKASARLEGEDRAELYKAIGGTNTPTQLWQRNSRGGGPRAGTAPSRARSTDCGPARTAGRRSPEDRPGPPIRRGPRNFVIDCTGLEADISEHRVLADLLEHAAGPQPDRPARCRAHLRGARHAQPAGRSTLRAAPRWAATSRGSTPSSGCRSPPRKSATTWPGWVSAEVRGRRLDPSMVALGPQQEDLREHDATHPVRADPDPDLAADRVRRYLDADHHAVLPTGVRSAPNYRTTFMVLLTVLVLGIALGARLPRAPAVPLGEGLAHLLRAPHHDQRGSAGLAPADRRRRARHRRGPTRLLIQFITTWLVIWLVANGPVQISSRAGDSGGGRFCVRQLRPHPR